MLVAMASADDASHGGDGAPLGTGAREPTSWGDRTIGRDGLRAPLETGVREPWIDRIEPGANDPRTWRDRAIGGGGLRSQTEPGETDPRIYRDRATGDDSPCGSTQERFRWTLEVAIWFLEIMLDALHIALQHMQRRIQ